MWWKLGNAVNKKVRASHCALWKALAPLITPAGGNEGWAEVSKKEVEHESREEHSSRGNSICKGPGLEEMKPAGQGEQRGTLVLIVCVTEIQMTCSSVHVEIYPDKYCPPVPPTPPRFHLRSYPSSLLIGFTVGLLETQCIMSSFPKMSLLHLFIWWFFFSSSFIGI